MDQLLVYNRFGSFNPYGMIYALRRDVVQEVVGSPGVFEPIGRDGGVPGLVQLREGKRPRPLTLRANVGDILEVRFTNLLAPVTPSNDAPATRLASIVASGLTPRPLDGDNHNPYNTGISGIEPGNTFTYRWNIHREGTYFFFSNSAPAGGEGNGGSMVHGLFGSINAEPTGSSYYRSQVTAEQMALASQPNAARPGLLNYETVDAAGDPILNMLKPLGAGPSGTEYYEIIHNDLNALIVGFDAPPDSGTGESLGWFREFTVVMHGELKTFYEPEFEILDSVDDGPLSGIRDGFGINYGASGLGTILFANRIDTKMKGTPGWSSLGPTENCVECQYEEFFLESWANGDPALLVQYPDDPSNVHHSYLGDNIRFRNTHAGPKETHVFHLHAHQWLSQSPGADTGTYLDSQTIGPMHGFTYNIYYGGSGNRNLTPGDSIFHCHLYPHFAQGMWELWRTHDVFEDGTRRLPDGKHGPGTDPKTGVTAALPDGTPSGTPIPALVPLPDRGMMPMPTYLDTVVQTEPAMPGFPFYIAGKAGHRVSQAPLDMFEDAGLPRHLILDGTRTTHEDLAAADFSVQLHTAHIQVLPQDGTPIEKAAMLYHGENATIYPDGKRGYDSVTPAGDPARILVNGRPAQPGAPFADPCISDDMASVASALGKNGSVTETRDYHVSAIQLDLVVNSVGWHDPQARINVLDEDVEKFEGKKRVADPFFFRVLSGECVRFFHTNRTPKELDVDDFQVRTPTDMIGQHIHLVKFDVTASDGSGNGWNYEDGTFSRGAVEERIHASNAVITNASGIITAEGSAFDMNGDSVTLSAKVKANLESVYQTTIQRWWADPLISTSGGDRTIGTVFTHDHFAPSSIQQHGFYNAMLVEPAGSEWLKPDGTPLLNGVGTQAIIQNADDPILHPDHREFAMAVADFSLLYEPNTGNPIDAPIVPEAISKEHHNPYLVNYKQEPIPLRIADFDASGGAVIKAGAAGDMAHVFDSHVHGDPFTEIFRTYEGDRIRIKVIQGAQEVQHEFSITGMRWRRNIWDPKSPYINSQEIGISEHFEMELPRFPSRFGLDTNGNESLLAMDMLYHFSNTDDMWSGTWGLLRYVDPVKEQAKAPGDPTKLAQLQDNPAFSNGSLLTAVSQVSCPEDPDGKITKEFNIQAWTAAELISPMGIVYNSRENITDPSGLLYIQVDNHDMTRQQVIDSFVGKTVEPLVIRANAGDCIIVHLKNMLPKDVPDHIGDAGQMPITTLRADDFRPSNMVSIMPQLVENNFMEKGGANIGLNPNTGQMAAPLETVDYMWYAGRMVYEPHATMPDKLTVKFVPEEFGAVNLNSWGDIVKHGEAGLVGVLIIEPEGSTVTPDPTSNMTADVCYPTQKTLIDPPVQECFREFVLVYQGGLNLLHNYVEGMDLTLSENSGVIIPNCYTCDDTYDLGDRAINYRAEPFWARLGADFVQAFPPGHPEFNFDDTNASQFPADFFLSTYKSIETPVFKAKPTDNVRFWVVQPHGRTRQRAFSLYGHDYDDNGISGFGTPHASLITVGKAVKAQLLETHEGTWLFRDGPNYMWGQGVWGQLVVKSEATP